MEDATLARSECVYSGAAVGFSLIHDALATTGDDGQRKRRRQKIRKKREKNKETTRTLYSRTLSLSLLLAPAEQNASTRSSVVQSTSVKHKKRHTHTHTRIEREREKCGPIYKTSSDYRRRAARVSRAVVCPRKTSGGPPLLALPSKDPAS